MMQRNGVILVLVAIGAIDLTIGLARYDGRWALFGAAIMFWLLAGTYGYLTRRRRSYRE